ncbi:MAG: hypothetical protein AAF492_00910 [Verrucomicrobiota bacterium]
MFESYLHREKLTDAQRADIEGSRRKLQSLYDPPKPNTSSAAMLSPASC